jgi:formate hydrogenlyase transcriptional activator
MDPERHFESGVDVDRYEALLQMADLMVHHRGVPELLPELAKRLRQVASFEIASFSPYDPKKKVMRMHFWEGSERLSDLTELPVEESPCGFVWERQQPMVWPDLQLETRFQRAVRKKGVRSYCTLPPRPRKRGSVPSGWEVPVVTHTTTMICISCGELPKLVALALENAMTRAAFLEEKERLEMLLEVSTTLMSNLDVQQLFPAISALIRKVVRQDYASVTLYEEANRCL